MSEHAQIHALYVVSHMNRGANAGTIYFSLHPKVSFEVTIATANLPSRTNDGDMFYFNHC